MLNPISPATRDFICAHRDADVRTLALQAARYPDVDMPQALAQIAGRQAAAVKIPSWAAVEGIRYPAHLPLEQCSSEAAARYKASLCRGGSLVDLTGGLGVDFSFMARGFAEAVYVERQETLCDLADHNFPLLGLRQARVCRGDGVAYLQAMTGADCLFVDPARRDADGRKTVLVSQCEPDVARLEPLLLAKAGRVWVKLSPMLDASQAVKELPHTQAVHVVAVGNECKELLLQLGRERVDEVPFCCVDLSARPDAPTAEPFVFTREQESRSRCTYADRVGAFLYEPHAALLKAGAYKRLAEAFPVAKLHSNSHLYTADEAVPGFPGRAFRVEAACAFHKREVRSLLDGLGKANLAVRNFPMPAAELRKRLRLADGGDVYLFATTLQSGRMLVRCRKLLG